CPSSAAPRHTCVSSNPLPSPSSIPGDAGRGVSRSHLGLRGAESRVLTFRAEAEGVGLPQIDKEARMAVARAVTFEGVDKDRMDEMDREMREGQPPEGFPAKEVLVLHDPEAEKSLVILFFETDDDYRRGDEVLNAMPAGETPGQRTSVTKYQVAFRMSG